ncbi:hypothetical protein COB21_05450 [Candidatus Aerophobetes bacterium]|uniref:Glycosyltransferase family 1 protein n=1 Tax=Aerophobetes bacterium TaxID=2030807 RepID=A0A2A4WZI9_UNCAE|nr:MAG: hypothetical protein COB21_05450 [Candidatus Aerophobetes bacterium]
MAAHVAFLIESYKALFLQRSLFLINKYLAFSSAQKVFLLRCTQFVERGCMLRIGISTSSYLNSDGSYKDYDGLGQFTRLVKENIDGLDGARVVPFNVSAARYLLSYVSPFPFYSTFEKSIDLFHATDFRVPKLNVPVVTTVHDAICLKYGDKSLKRRIANPLFQKGIDRADRVITDCHAMVADLEKYWGVNPSKVDVVYPGRDPFFDHRCKFSEIETCLKAFKLDRPYILMVSTLRNYKNIDRLLDAYLSLSSINSSIDLVLVGKMGSEKIHKKMHIRVKQLNSAKKVRWLSYVGKDQLRALYQGALGAVLPSLYEGFGFPILEAFASEIPLLTSGCGAMQEIAGVGNAIFVDPYSVDSIRYGIEQLVQDQTLRVSLIKAGKKRVKDFSWDVAAKQMLSVYKKVTQQKERV